MSRPTTSFWLTTGALLCTATALAQTPPARTTARPSDQLEVIATLLDAPPETPACGFLHTAVAMRYRVDRVVRGTYPSAELYAIHGCPGMSRQQYAGHSGGTVVAFRAGERHRLVLRRALPSGAAGPSLWPQPDLSAVPRTAVYWTVRADAVTP